MRESKTRTKEDLRAGANRQPPGVLPRNIHRWVIGLIVLVIVSMSAWSGKKKAEPAPKAVPVAGPSQSQLASFQKQLESDRKRMAEEAMRRRLAEASVEKPENHPLLPPPASRSTRAYASGEADPVAVRRRVKAETSPLASSVVIRVEDPPLDRTSQIAVDGKEVSHPGQSAADKASSASPASPEGSGVRQPTTDEKPSGRYLPARLQSREGELFRLFEGTVIQTALENTLDGSFTGPVRCVVKAAVMSADGTTVLIPENARFLGEAKRVEEQNQTRLQVTFSRLLRPDGYSIDLESAPGLDSSGQTGLKDKVDRHHRRTFGISGAIGLLGGLAQLGGQGNPYTWGVGRSMGNSATNALSRYLNAIPTITIRKNHPVVVYLPTDLLLPAYRPVK